MIKKTLSIICLVYFTSFLYGCLNSSGSLYTDPISYVRSKQVENTMYIGREIANTTPEPLPKKWQKIVKDKIMGSLRDPYSAKFKTISKPEYYGYKYMNGEEYIGWAGIAIVNAKNSFGAYSGNNTCLYIITKDKGLYLQHFKFEAASIADVNKFIIDIQHGSIAKK